MAIGPTIVSAMTPRLNVPRTTTGPGSLPVRSEGSSRLVPSTPVDLLSDQLRQTVKFAAKSERRVGVVISQEFVGKISAETKWSAEGRTPGTGQRSRGRWCRRRRRRTAMSCLLPEKRSKSAHQVGRWDAHARALQHARKRGDDAGSAYWEPKDCPAHPRRSGRGILRCCRGRWAGPRPRSAELSFPSNIS